VLNTFVVWSYEGRLACRMPCSGNLKGFLRDKFGNCAKSEASPEDRSISHKNCRVLFIVW